MRTPWPIDTPFHNVPSPTREQNQATVTWTAKSTKSAVADLESNVSAISGTASAKVSTLHYPSSQTAVIRPIPQRVGHMFTHVYVAL